MLPYLLVLIFVMFWILLEKRLLGRKAFWIPFFVLSIFSSLRSNSVGADSKNYTRDFVNQLDVTYYDFSEGNEIGFQLLHYFILSFTKNYFWLFFISSIIVLYCYLSIFKKYSKDYFLSIVIFITFGFYTFYFNGLRQGLAMAIAVLATPYLIEKKLFKFLVIIFMASLFHRSALVLILFYFIVHLRIKIEYKMLLIFIGSLGLSGLVVQYLSTINEKYETYSQVSEKSGGYLTLSVYFLIGCFIYWWIKENTKESIAFIKLSEFYLYGIIFLIPVAMLGANASGPQRLLFYFAWSIIILLPIILVKINNKVIYNLFILLCVIYFYLTTSRFSLLTPYSINEAFRIF